MQGSDPFDVPPPTSAAGGEVPPGPRPPIAGGTGGEQPGGQPGGGRDPLKGMVDALEGAMRSVVRRADRVLDQLDPLADRIAETLRIRRPPTPPTPPPPGPME